MSTYVPTVPTGLVFLDQDYQNIQNNFQQLNTTYAIDHVALTDNSGTVPAGKNGAHKTVHMVPFSTTTTNAPNNQPVVAPAAVSGMGEMFAAQINDGLSVDEVLYYQSGGGRITQMTRNFTPVKATSGRTFLPGGLILQWGSFNPNLSLNVLFSIPFPNSIYNLQLTGSASDKSSYRNNLSTGSLALTGFTWEGSVDNKFTPIYYLAIGN